EACVHSGAEKIMFVGDLAPPKTWLEAITVEHVSESNLQLAIANLRLDCAGSRVKLNWESAVRVKARVKPKLYYRVRVVVEPEDGECVYYDVFTPDLELETDILDGTGILFEEIEMKVIVQAEIQTESSVLIGYGAMKLSRQVS